MRIAVGKSIKSGAKDNVLSDALCDGAGEFVFGVATPRRHEGTESARKGVVLFRVGSKFLRRFGADNKQGQGIVKNPGLVKKLMRRPANGDAVGCSTEFAFLHCCDSDTPSGAKLGAGKLFLYYRFEALHSLHGQTSRRNFQE